MHRQCLESKIDFEIIVMDDASDKEYRKLLSNLQSLSNVKVIYNEKNLGRNRVRRSLAEAAKFDYLLFSDCDNEMTHSTFIKKYIDKLTGNSVVIGGRIYVDKKPKRKKVLHWTYGRKREQKNEIGRNRFPYRSFMTNNFLIPKKIFLDLEHKDDISGYGHEDTLMGIQLQIQKVPVIHINNPMLHAGLEDADEFLEKSKNAIQNLQRLYQSSYRQKLEESVRLVRYYSYLKKYKMLFGLRSVSIFKKIILKNINSSNPSLRLFDILKLYWFAQL